MWPSAGGRFPPPQPPPRRGSRVSWALTRPPVPTMFRRSGASASISKRSSVQLYCSEHRSDRWERTFDPSHGGGRGFKSRHLHYA